jgi:hypothetical protein
VKTVQPLLELQSGGIFAIGNFPDAMMVDGEVVGHHLKLGILRHELLPLRRQLRRQL